MQAAAGRRNRTIKEGEADQKTIRGIVFPLNVKRFHDDGHDQMRQHLANFISACNFGRRLKTLKRLTPYEFICKPSTIEPERFTLNPIHQMPGLNNFAEKILLVQPLTFRGDYRRAAPVVALGDIGRLSQPRRLCGMGRGAPGLSARLCRTIGGFHLAIAELLA